MQAAAIQTESAKRLKQTSAKVLKQIPYIYSCIAVIDIDGQASISM